MVLARLPSMWWHRPLELLHERLLVSEESLPEDWWMIEGVNYTRAWAQLSSVDASTRFQFKVSLVERYTTDRVTSFCLVACAYFKTFSREFSCALEGLGGVPDS